MTLDVQFKLKANPLYKNYIRQNTNWYKVLTRNPESFRNFEEEVKSVYRLRPTDRINKMLEIVGLAGTFMSALK